MDNYTSPQGGDRSNDSGIVDKVRERATAQLSSQKDKATDGLGTVAQAVRQTTQSLRDQQHDTVAQYVERAADQIERVSERLKNKDVGELLDDAQQLARRQPALFIGGAFALGLVGARFLKSSSPDRGLTNYDRSGGYGSGSYGSTGYGTGYGQGAGTSGSYGSTAYVTGGTSRGYAPTTPSTPSATDPGLDRERF